MKKWIALLCVIALLFCVVALVACKEDANTPDTEQSESETPGGETLGGETPATPGNEKGEKDPSVSDNFQ